MLIFFHPWGGLSRKEGEAYLDETLGELAGKGCLSFDKSPRGEFSVELKDPPDSFRYFEELASPQLLDWIEKLQSAEELALYLVSGSWFLVHRGGETSHIVEIHRTPRRAHAALAPAGGSSPWTPLGFPGLPLRSIGSP